MKRFTDAGRRAIVDGNWYAGLSLALMIPDICASLEDPGPGKSQIRYESWFRQWVEPKFSYKKRIFVSAENCYQLRCSLIHSGRVDIEAKKASNIDRFEFCDDTVGAHMNMRHSEKNGVKQPSFLQLMVSPFSNTLYDAADEWDAASLSSSDVQGQKNELLEIRTKGDTVGGPGGMLLR